MSWLQIKEKEEQRIKLVRDAGEIVRTAHKENRDMTPEENEKWDKHHKDSDALLEDIRRLEKQQSAEKSLEERIGRDDPEVTKPVDKTQLQNRAFDKFLRFGKDQLNTEELRALSADGTGDGVDLVPDEFVKSFHEVMQDVDDVRQTGCEVITTSSGAPYPLPVVNDTSNTGELLAEHAAAEDDGSSDPATSTVTLNAYIYSSKIVRVSTKLARDNTYNLQGFLARALGTRVAKASGAHFTTGSGSSQPQGFITGATVGKTAAATGAVTYNEVLDLIHSVSRIYRKNGVFSFSDATWLALRKLTDADGNLLWIPRGGADQGAFDTLAGYKVVVNDSVADMAASAKSIAFGSFFDAFAIRDVVGAELIVFTEKYRNQLQFGYLLASSHDSATKDTTAVKVLQMASA